MIIAEDSPSTAAIPDAVLKPTLWILGTPEQNTEGAEERERVHPKKVLVDNVGPPTFISFLS